jgi:hypothetical protein
MELTRISCIEKPMDNNNNKELIAKLEREIWLFEQWLAAIDGQVAGTQKRIKVAYQECIASRQAKVFELASQLKSDQATIKENNPFEAMEA